MTPRCLMEAARSLSCSGSNSVRGWNRLRSLAVPSGQVPRADEVRIRTTAVYTNTPIMTTLSRARAVALGVAALKKRGYTVKTLQEYH